jgi:hypothetical protein
MRNVIIKTEGDKLTITVDLSKNLGRSRSGKSLLIGSTDGAATVDTKGGRVSVGLNVYTTDKGGTADGLA